MAKIEFNQQEAERLFELLDMAVKYEGMEVAQDALYFNQKVSQAMQQEAQQQVAQAQTPQAPQDIEKDDE